MIGTLYIVSFERVLGVSDASFLRSLNVQLVFVVGMVSSLQSLISPAFPTMTETLGIPEASIGLVFTAYTFPAIVLLPIMGTAADIFGRKFVVVPGLLLFGGAGMAIGFVTSFETILALRVLQGIGYAAFNPLTVVMLGDLLSGPTESAAQGTRVVLNNSTAFFGPVVGGILAGIAWNYPFMVYAVGIPVGLLVLFKYTEEDARGFNDNPSASFLTTLRQTLGEYFRDMLSVSRDPFILGILTAGFLRMFLKYTLYTFLALAIVQQYGGSFSFAGLLIGAYSGIGAVVATQAARFTESLSYEYALIVGFLVASVAFSLFPIADGVLVLTVLVLLHGVGEGIINPIHKSLLTQSVTREARAGLSALNGTVQAVSKTATPVVMSFPLLLFGSPRYDLLFLIAGVISLAASLVSVVALSFGGMSPRRTRLRS